MCHSFNPFYHHHHHYHDWNYIIANINMAKLDEAFDIDPLFHKMSKTFDEGGAKGLLLANLGVSLQGCNIVFDSTLENDHEDEDEEEKTPDPHESMEPTNVTSLVNKLESSLGGQPIHLLPLVPQLATLRDEYAHLHQEGYVDKTTPSTRRYAAPQEDEVEADRSIHLEAIERSRASQADLGRSLMAQDDHDQSTLDDGPIDFGAGNDFGDDDDDDCGTDNLIGTTLVHDGDHRFSSSSFQTSFEASQPPSQATLLLDAIASGHITGSQSNYEFFNQQALDKIQGNMWAGAAHWKKMPQPKRKTTSTTTTSTSATNTPKKGKGKKKTAKAIALSNILNLREPVENLEDLLRKPPKKGRKGVDPLQLSKAVQTKHAKNDNLLPLDIGLKVEALSTLFLRPKTILMTGSEDAGVANAKQVGFSGVDTWNDGNSLGEDNDGPGFDFGGNDDDDQDSFVPELEGVRKVEKVQVGYATIAKKVDVKRLKLDLWEELECKFAKKEDHPDEEAMDDSEIEEEDAPIAPKSISAAPGPLSFQDTVKEMQGTQKQTDVTLPFYFICMLHLANEKGLALESTGLEDFIIRTS
jgi:condensin complex subunit 2